MYNYQIAFSKYKIRSYEKELALHEFKNLFPKVNFNITDEKVCVQSEQALDLIQLKKLTFFSEITVQNAHPNPKKYLTQQSILEATKKLPYTQVVSKELLNNIKSPQSREIRYLCHSFHEYKGRFYPQLVKAFFNYANLPKDALVLDPFCGSGTTLVESFLYGTQAIGLDINPLAYIIAKAKIRSFYIPKEDLQTLKTTYKNFELSSNTSYEILKETYQHLDVNYLERWFPTENLHQIFCLLNSFETYTEDIQLLLKITLSNLLRTYSYQVPNQLRIRRRKDAPPTNLIESFLNNLNKNINTILKFHLLFDLRKNSNIKNHLCDIKELNKKLPLKENSVDIVVTSPPYATALPYVDTDRLSIFLFGYTDSSSFRKLEKTLIGNREITKKERLALESALIQNFTAEKTTLPQKIIDLLQKIYLLNSNSDVGFRRKNMAALLYKYFIDMKLALQQIKFVLKPEQYMFMVVGNNKTTAGGEKINIPTDDFIALIAEMLGFKLENKINMSVQKSYTIYSKNAINTESILVFKN